LFLNSGDWLVDENVLQNVFSETITQDILYGSVIYKGIGNEPDVQIDYPLEKYITFRYFFFFFLHHQCTFFKRELFDKVGLYNENLIYSSDWEFYLLAICRYNASILKIHFPISFYDMTGISSQTKNRESLMLERNIILKEHFSYFLDDYKYLDKIKKLYVVRLHFKIKSFLKKTINYKWAK